MDYFTLPKIDLHCHLDGSVRPQTIIDLAKQQDITLPSTDINEVESLMVVPENCPNLDEYIKRFELPISVMQTEEAIERISFELFEDAAKENIKYLEVRFGPQLHGQKGLNFDQIISSAVKGMKKAEAKYDIHGNYILSILKTLPKDDIYDVIDAGAAYLGSGVVAFDLAASELDGFCHEFIPYAQYAKEKGYKITIHAGEQGSGQNVHDAIELLGAERIGHGIAIEGHKPAYQLVKEQSVALEACPTSNAQTKAVDKISNHPIKRFLKDDINVTINTDNRTVSNTSMTEEVRKVMETFKLTKEDYAQIYRISVEHAFATDAVKAALLKHIK